MNNPSILGLGNAIVDIVSKVSDEFILKNKLIKGSMKLIKKKQLDTIINSIKIKKIVAGGSVANSIVGLTKLGNNGLFLGKINDDEFGIAYEKSLKKEGVNFCYKKKVEKLPTGVCIVLVTPDRNRTMCTYLGISQKIVVNDINPKLIQKSNMVLLEGYLWDTPETKDAFKKTIKIAKKTAFSLSDKYCVERHKKDFLNLIKNKIDIIFSNENEILSLCNTQDIKKAINICSQLKKLFIITRSEKGSVAVSKNNINYCDAIKNIKVIDVTGAGDLFLSGFLDSYFKKKNIDECLYKGNLMASRIIQKFGSRL